MAANAEFQDLAASHPKFEVKFVGGPRYDLSNLPKTKSGNRRRSFRRRKIPQQLEGIGLLFNRVSLFDTIKKRWIVIAFDWALYSFL